MKRLVFVGLVAFVTGCDSPAMTPPAAAPSVTSSPTPSLEISCGEVVMDQGEQLSSAGATELACLESALREGRRARLTVTAPSVEGRPSVFHWQLSADRALSADIDSSRDPFSSDAHSHHSCGRISELPDPLTCTPSG